MINDAHLSTESVLNEYLFLAKERGLTQLEGILSNLSTGSELQELQVSYEAKYKAFPDSIDIELPICLEVGKLLIDFTEANVTPRDYDTDSDPVSLSVEYDNCLQGLRRYIQSAPKCIKATSYINAGRVDENYAMLTKETHNRQCNLHTCRMLSLIMELLTAY